LDRQSSTAGGNKPYQEQCVIGLIEHTGDLDTNKTQSHVDATQLEIQGETPDETG
jgi:hypothetical protein